MNRYQISSWTSIRQRAGEIPPGLARSLRESARPRQVAYTRLMRGTGGNPAYVECKSKTRDAWAFVLPDVNGGCWRIQHFDRFGFSGHHCYPTVEIATETMIYEGYVEQDVGALDRCSSTSIWAIGVKSQELKLLYEQGAMSWAEMAARRQDIIASFHKEGSA